MAASAPLHEDVLRHLWSRQYLRADELRTSDDRPLRVIDPGQLQRGAGPDFHDAVIEIAGRTYRGDIEFHRSIEDWETHAHGMDERYNSVVLHVVFASSSRPFPTHVESGREVPVLFLDRFLTAPLEEIAEHTIRDEVTHRRGPIRCYGKTGHLAPALIGQLLGTLFLERIQRRTEALANRLAEITEEHEHTLSEPPSVYGEPPDGGDPQEIPVPTFCIERGALNRLVIWEQLLYEGIMEGLGYSGNRTPFLRLARILPLWRWRQLDARGPLTNAEIEALLFHTSGLLPASGDVDDPHTKAHIHELSVALAGLGWMPAEVLGASDWQLAPTRPSNFPTIRIGAAGLILAKILHGHLFQHIITVCSGEHAGGKEKRDMLLGQLETGEDSFWSYHYVFGDATAQAHTLLGRVRRSEILINTVIPVCCLYANIFEKERIRAGALSAALTMEALEENAIIAKMQDQLIGTSMALTHAFQQQGVMELYRSYCQHERCEECAVGRAVFPHA